MNFAAAVNISIQWLKLNPWFVPATVALVIASYTQWSLTRRTNRELFIKKIEETYLIVSQTMTATENRFEAVMLCFFHEEVMHPDLLKKNVYSAKEVANYRCDEKLMLYIKLYFEGMESNYDALVRAQDKFTSLINMIGTYSELGHEQTPKRADFKAAYVECENACKAMELELLKRMKKVTRKNSLFR